MLRILIVLLVLVYATPVALSDFHVLPLLKKCHNNKIPIIHKALDKFELPREKIAQFSIAINNASNIYGIDPLVLVALIWQESSFRTNVRGSAGEIGPTQISPYWASYFKIPISSLFDLETNVLICARILRMHYDRYNDPLLALRAYNGKSKKGLQYAKQVKKKYKIIASL